MSRTRVYLKPFDDSGVYLSSWVEITDDVQDGSIGTISQSLEANEFDVGVTQNSNSRITLRNDHGKYSDVGTTNTLFKFKRSDTQVRITWDHADFSPLCGSAVCNQSAVSTEVEIFKGLLSDKSLKMNLVDHKVSFSVLGRESIFANVIAPLTLVNGDVASDVIFKCLNQSRITDFLTVDSLNITCDNDVSIDDVSKLANKTVKEVLDQVLLISNSVLYVLDDTILVKGRVPSTGVVHTFYGQASDVGRENINTIRDIKNGSNRIINFLTWKEGTSVSQNATSVLKNGYQKKEVSFEAITNETTRKSVLDSIRDEFSDPKQEFSLSTPLDYKTMSIGMLDRISLDYPIIIVSTDDLPLYDVAEYEVARYPKEVTNFSVLPSEHYKVIGKKINLSNLEVVLAARRI